MVVDPEEKSVPVHFNSRNPTLVLTHSTPNVAAEVLVELVAWSVVLVQIGLELMSWGAARRSTSGTAQTRQEMYKETHRF